LLVGEAQSRLVPERRRLLVQEAQSRLVAVAVAELKFVDSGFAIHK